MKAAAFLFLLTASVHAKDRAPYLVEASSVAARACWRQGGKDDCATFTGLAPGAAFSYSIPGSSSTFSARTLPADSAPLRFAVLGDSGMATAAQKRVAGVLERQSPDFILHVGDVVYPTGRDEDYDAKYFRIYKRLLAGTAVFPCPGNHDYGNAHKSAAIGEKRLAQGYARVFRRPKYYSFDAGPAHFISLDTNRADDIAAAADIGLDSEQRRWLEKDLTASKARWKFVFMHVPLYSTYYRHGDNALLRASLQGLFEKYRVDAVFAGHDHLYQRSKRINKVVYLTVGTGGANIMGGPLADHPWLERELVSHGAALARVDGRRLTLEFRDEDGLVQDSLSIDKP